MMESLMSRTRIEVTPEELQFVEEARHYLEQPSFLIRLASLLGTPLEKLGRNLPENIRKSAGGAAMKALGAAANTAVKLIPDGKKNELSIVDAKRKASQVVTSHNAVSALSGGIGGFFGGWAIGAELPVSTTIMLRSIAKIAQIFGEDISQQDVRAECLSVFAYGSASKADDAAESSYFMVRASLAKALQKESSVWLSRGAGSVAGQVIARIAQRFEIVVSEKLIAQAIPVVGAVGGASVNALFADHFAKVAMYHFGMRALERKYGKLTIEKTYLALDSKPS